MGMLAYMSCCYRLGALGDTTTDPLLVHLLMRKRGTSPACVLAMDAKVGASKVGRSATTQCKWHVVIATWWEAPHLPLL
jgi:hypothetical protein